MFIRPRDSHPRSVVKAITWRMTGSLDTFVLSWLITGNLAFAGSIASAETVTKIALYYVHERAWGAVRWGEAQQGLVVVPASTSAVERKDSEGPHLVNGLGRTSTAALFRRRAAG